jgi:tungstate transport system substrate-binding protein
MRTFAGFYVAVILAAGCGVSDSRDRVLLVTTHSVEDSGLLGTLAAAFHATHPEFRVLTTAVGSGAALEIGRRGDADLLLTHDPEGEIRFMSEGHGVERRPVMENDFVLAGPPGDPAGVSAAADAPDAFRLVAGSRSRFLSRGDDSGTHRKERALWREAGLEPWVGRPAWYIEAGIGMAETLQMASQLGAYVLTDLATYRNTEAGRALGVVFASDPRLLNPYSIIVPRRQRNPTGARVLADWLVGPGQEVIAGYGRDRFDTPLFRATGRPE